MSLHLPRVTAFPILPESHVLYKASKALVLPAKERPGSPLIGHKAPEIILKDQLGRDCVSIQSRISIHDGRPSKWALGRTSALHYAPAAIFAIAFRAMIANGCILISSITVSSCNNSSRSTHHPLLLSTGRFAPLHLGVLLFQRRTSRIGRIW